MARKIMLAWHERLTGPWPESAVVGAGLQRPIGLVGYVAIRGGEDEQVFVDLDRIPSSGLVILCQCQPEPAFLQHPDRADVVRSNVRMQRPRGDLVEEQGEGRRRDAPSPVPATDPV